MALNILSKAVSVWLENNQSRLGPNPNILKIKRNSMAQADHPTGPVRMPETKHNTLEGVSAAVLM